MLVRRFSSLAMNPLEDLGKTKTSPGEWVGSTVQWRSTLSLPVVPSRENLWLKTELPYGLTAEEPGAQPVGVGVGGGGWG